MESLIITVILALAIRTIVKGAKKASQGSCGTCEHNKKCRNSRA